MNDRQYGRSRSQMLSTRSGLSCADETQHTHLSVKLSMLISWINEKEGKTPQKSQCYSRVVSVAVLLPDNLALRFRRQPII